MITRESNKVQVNIHVDICYAYNIQSPGEAGLVAAVTDLVRQCAGKLAREKSPDLQHLLSLTVAALSVQLISSIQMNQASVNAEKRDRPLALTSWHKLPWCSSSGLGDSSSNDVIKMIIWYTLGYRPS